MACPKCGGKVTYSYIMDDVQDDYDMERCAACGAIFYLMDAEEDYDQEPEDFQIQR